MPELELSQERPEVRRGIGPVKQLPHPAVTEQVHVIDRVRPGEHPRHQRRDLRPGVRALVGRDTQLVLSELREPGRLREPEHRASPAADTRLGSSKTADTAAGACLNCIYEMPLESEEQNPTQVLFSLIREAFPCHDSRSEPPPHRWIQA